MTQSPAERVIVETSLGLVIGSRNTTCKNKDYCSFQGIPYAKPPIGDLRFKDPIPMDSWLTSVDATKPAPFAYSYECDLSGKIAEHSSEDCLYLNIFTKEPGLGRKRPVMVWIHGGGFVMGSTDETATGPDFLLKKNIVFVTIAYRLGALGFLSINNLRYGIPGNAGLKDQLEALKWIGNNIQHFGGDANNITVFGQGAGAISIHYHLMSELSRNLFHKAILHSGSGFSGSSMTPATGSDWPKKLANRLGWNGEGGTKAMLAILRSAKPEKLVEAQDLITEEDRQNGIYFSFLPVIEPYDLGNCFIPKEPKIMAETAWGNNIPLIVGGVADEGELFESYIFTIRMFENDDYFNNAIPQQLNLPKESEERVRLGKLLKSFYFGENVNITDEDMPIYNKLIGDKLIWHGIYGCIRQRMLDPKSNNTYLFYFGFQSTNPIIINYKNDMCGRRVRGVIHSEDLFYIFKMKDLNENFSSDQPESQIITKFVNMWTYFAETGDPNYSSSDPVQWDPIPRNNIDGVYKCLNISNEISFIDFPLHERVLFWNSLYKY